MEQSQTGLLIPLVSVIVPNFNHARFLEKRLDSILVQSYPNFEVIVLDDCSTDNSLDVIGKYSHDKHVSQVVVNETNSGCVFKQWKKGLDLAKGELVWIAESDDYCDSTLLEKLVEQFVKYPKLSFAYATSVWIDENDKEITKTIGSRVSHYKSIPFLKKQLLFENCIFNASSALVKTEFARKCHNYTSYFSSGDNMFWIEMAFQGEVHCVNEPLNYFRRHSNCLTGKKMMEGLTYREDFEIAKYLKSRLKISNLRNRLSMLYKHNVIMDLEFATPEIKNKLLTLWGAPFSKVELLCFRIYRYLRFRHHVYL